MTTTTAPITDDELRALVRELVASVDHTDRVAFRGAQYDRGLAWVQFPVGLGGLGLSPRSQTAVNEELRSAGVRWYDLVVNPIGIGMAAPVVLAHGSPDLAERFLRRIFTGEDIWCQLFSEPSAGSDVAGLATRAVRDGDEWVVNGQKVWTTLAHVSNWGLLAARTNPEAPKHKGLSYFVLDMHAPGVEVRPLYQITGEAEFNEVFLTDVRIPDAMMLGDEGDGWRVALTTLMNERVALGGAVAGRGEGSIRELLDVWHDHVAREGDDPVRRDRVVQLWIRAEALRLTNLRARGARATGTPGPEGSVSKLASAELNKHIYEEAIALLGADGLLFPTGYERHRAEAVGLGGGQDIRKTFLRMRANSIEGGTSEVMRNILGEQVLGLPGDVRVDKGMPWSDIPRN
jgi:alkylation response protein AidB-like acyl-CoA dehydrogenase